MKAQTMLAAELAAMSPKSVASLAWTRGRERSPPLSVTLKGRPNGRISALSKVAVTAKQVTACVASMNSGKVRAREIQPI